MLTVDQQNPDSSVVAQAVETAKNGGVLVLPTDSVYGLACAATAGNPAHQRIFDIKRRERTQTLPLFIADEADLNRYGANVPAWARDLARRFWPGALTLVVEASAALPAEYVQASTGTVALRVPGSELVRAVVRELGAPLAQTSANTHGAPAATSASELEPAVAEAADLVLDAGACPLGEASTIVDATCPEPRVLRQGAIRVDSGASEGHFEQN